MRWQVRREQTRQPKFGDRPADVVRWVVRMYEPLGTARLYIGEPVTFGALHTAVNYARGRCALHYYARRRGARAAASGAPIEHR